MKKEFTKEDSTSEMISMKGESKGLDREFFDAITTGTGPLVAGALPSLDVKSEQAMADSLSGGPSAKPKPRKVKREDVAQEVGPVTPKEFLGYIIT